MSKNNTKGFTLMELMVVVAAVTILALMTIYSMSLQLGKARDVRKKADMHRIQQAAEEYEKDHDCYPPPALINCNPGTGLAPYLNKVPCDAQTKVTYGYDFDTSSDCPKWYRVYAALENKKDKDYLPNVGPGHLYSFYLSSPNAPAPTSGTPAQPTATPIPGSCTYACFGTTCQAIPQGEYCSTCFVTSNCNGVSCGTVSVPQNQCH